MLRGVLAAQHRSLLPILRSSALGGVRTLRGRGGGQDDDEEDSGRAFIDAIGSNRRGGAGRGGNAYSRFLNVHKETVLEEEKPQHEYFTKQRKYQRAGRFSNADDDEDDDLLDKGDDDFLEGLMGAKPKQGGKDGPEEQQRPQQTPEERREQYMQQQQRRANKQEEVPEDEETYFDWNNEDMLIPGLEETNRFGEDTTDLIEPEDAPSIAFGKLMWRRVLIVAKDMDRYPHFEKSARVMESIAHHRKLRLEELKKEKEEEAKEQAEPPQAKQLDEDEDMHHVGEDGEKPVMYLDGDEEGGEDDDDEEEEEEDEETRQACDELNALQTVDEIDWELGRMIVDFRLEEEMLAQESETADEDELRRILGDDFDLAWDQASLQHVLDIHEETSRDVPGVDPQGEGFEAWQVYAEELARAGGIISYTYTADDKTDRKMRVPFPLGTKKVIKTSLELDKKYAPLAKKAPVAKEAAKKQTKIDPEVYGAHAWLSLAKNPTMGEHQRVKFHNDLMAKLRELQGDEPSPADSGKEGAQQKKQTTKG